MSIQREQTKQQHRMGLRLRLLDRLQSPSSKQHLLGTAARAYKNQERFEQREKRERKNKRLKIVFSFKVLIFFYKFYKIYFMPFHILHNKIVFTRRNFFIFYRDFAKIGRGSCRERV